MSTAPQNRKKLGLPCADKKRYSTYDGAVAVAVVRTEAWNGPDALRIYRCPHCGGYHLTSKVEPHRVDRRFPVITA